jgi:hypothetical protein
MVQKDVCFVVTATAPPPDDLLWLPVWVSKTVLAQRFLHSLLVKGTAKLNTPGTEESINYDLTAAPCF